MIDPRITLGRLLASSLIALGLWTAFHPPLTRAFRATTVALATLIGVETAVAGEARPAARGLADDQIAVLFSIRTDGRPRTRRTVMDLARWHVNLLVMPPLAFSIGGLGLGARLAIMSLGLPVLFLADACSALAYVLLGTARARDTVLLSPAVQASIEYLIAVVLPKLLPLLVWAPLYAVAHKRRRG